MSWRHGTTYGYELGCRCDPCSQATFAARRAARARARSENRPSYFRELAATAARKESYRGTCQKCGRATTGCFGPGLAPALCHKCSSKQTGLRRRGTGRVGPAALAYMAEPRHFMEIANHLGISKGYTGQLLHRLRSYGLITRLKRGVYQRTDV